MLFPSLCEHPPLPLNTLPNPQELSNAIIFYIHSWEPFAHALPTHLPAPSMGTISVSRRGVVNVRFAWHDGVLWTEDTAWVKLAEAVRDFLLEIS